MTKKTIASKAFRFTPEELALLEKLTTDGSYKDTVMKALRAMDAGKEITQDQVIDWIRRNAG
jgi:tRNA threonylcarbamoyladenosine modification (KEOPS) complex Cgi121 subunit